MNFDISSTGISNTMDHVESGLGPNLLFFKYFAFDISNTWISQILSFLTVLPSSR